MTVVVDVSVQRKKHRAALSRLMELAKPDAGRIVLGLSALAVNSATNLSFPWLLGQAVDRSGDANFMAGAAGLFLVGSVATWVRVYCLTTTTERISARIRRLIFESYVEKEVEFFESTTSGELMTILDKDVTAAAEILTEKVSNGLRSLNSSVNGSVVLFSIAPQLCTVSLAIVPVVGIGAMMLSKYSRKLREKARELEARMLSFALERIACISTVRLNGQGGKEKAAYSGFTDECYSLTSRSSFAQGGFMSFVNVMTNASLMAVLYVGGGLIAKGKLTAGSLTRFAMTSAFVGLGFSGLSTMHGDVIKSLDAAVRIFGVVDQKSGNCTGVNAGAGVRDVAAATISTGSTAPPASGESAVLLEEVHFSYPSRHDAPVLCSLTLSVPRHSLTAIVGKSGSGKSTILSLLCGLYRPASGRVALSGKDLSWAPQDWVLQQCGVVEQKLGLLSGSIADNIAYGMPGTAAVSTEAVVRAAKDAAAHDFISALPLGYDTAVGDGGQKLSGGQCARVALARALIRDPAVLLLDEVTAALDEIHEAEVVALLSKLSKRCTIVAVTHSQSLMQAADCVVVVVGGKVQHKGSFAELRAAGALEDVLASLS